MDVGAVDGHYFLNSCGFGFDPAVLAATKRVHFLKGNAVYVYSALGQLLTYRGMAVKSDSIPDVPVRRVLMVTVSNGCFLGGAFLIAPDASVLDGKLDLAFFRDTNTVGRVRLFVRALRGTHLALRQVSAARAQLATLNFADAPMMEIDGELRQASSSTVTIECLPGALNVIAAPGFPR
jgi:diacylglycerol kinase family enzyme